MGHPLALGVFEEHLRAGMERRAVEEQERRATREAGGEPIPHHPAERGEVEQPIAFPDVGVKPELLQMLQQHAGAVHDAFGAPVVPDE